jgi:hypothetical protein
MFRVVQDLVVRHVCRVTCCIVSPDKMEEWLRWIEVFAEAKISIKQCRGDNAGEFPEGVLIPPKEHEQAYQRLIENVREDTELRGVEIRHLLEQYPQAIHTCYIVRSGVCDSV